MTTVYRHEHEPGEFAPLYSTRTPYHAATAREDLREHMREAHAASDDWSRLVAFDLVHEQHNRAHHLDAFGQPL